MQLQEIRNKTAEELTTQKVALRKETMNLNFMRSNQEEVPLHRFKQIRRTLARIETVLKERQPVGGQNA